MLTFEVNVLIEFCVTWQSVCYSLYHLKDSIYHSRNITEYELTSLFKLSYFLENGLSGERVSVERFHNQGDIPSMPWGSRLSNTRFSHEMFIF